MNHFKILIYKYKFINYMTDFTTIFNKSLNSGLAGASAMCIQVCSLMPLRTVMNYQYRHGGSIFSSYKTLYNDGGIKRFYKGIGTALIQGPSSRFGDTFSNTFALTLCKENEYLNKTPILFQTIFASSCAGAFRILLMPIDTVKTNYQVNGNLSLLKQNISNHGIRFLYNGSLATASATAVGHFPWFYTFNYLDKTLPKYDDKPTTLVRNAFMGFCSSIASDTISNSIRVLKTSKQTYPSNTSYVNIGLDIIKKDGCVGLFGRGLKIRLITNGIQGVVFSVLWKLFDR
jgi:hypothetical protein